jgi:fatty-acyl-CoA synthase
VVTNLPTYARPLFLRVSPEEMEVTGTFKHRKVALVAEGFDPSVVKDPLFFLQGEEYVPLTPAVYFGICSGQIRV